MSHTCANRVTNRVRSHACGHCSGHMAAGQIDNEMTAADWLVVAEALYPYEGARGFVRFKVRCVWRDLQATGADHHVPTPPFRLTTCPFAYSQRTAEEGMKLADKAKRDKSVRRLVTSYGN